MTLSTIIDNIIKKVNLGTRLIGVSKNFTGFPNRNTSIQSSNNDTITLTFNSDTLLYKQGKEYKFTSGTVLNLDVSGVRGGTYVGVNPETASLELLSNIPNFSTDLLCFYIYRNATELIIDGDERHSASRSTDWHTSQHLNVGAVLRSGGLLNLTLNSETDLNVELTTPIVFADEDIVHTITNGSSGSYQQILTGTALIPCIYLGSDMLIQQLVPSAVPFPIGTTRAKYNDISNGTLVEADKDGFICYYLILTNDRKYPVKWVIGRAIHDKIDDAVAESYDSLGLSLPELVPLNKVILETNHTFLNKIKFVANYKLVDRLSSVNTSFIPTNHSSLFGRDEPNQHTIDSITGLSDELSSKVSKITSTDNAIVRFDGTTGEVQNSNIFIDDNGNLLSTSSTGAFGYGTGAGGTVTQLTSKSTSVNLNKPCGRIIMNNSLLGGGSITTFFFGNSLITANDMVYCHALWSNSIYRVEVYSVANGGCSISVKNESGSNLSDAVPLAFCIIKGAIS